MSAAGGGSLQTPCALHSQKGAIHRQAVASPGPLSWSRLPLSLDITEGLSGLDVLELARSRAVGGAPFRTGGVAPQRVCAGAQLTWRASIRAVGSVLLDGRTVAPSSDALHATRRAGNRAPELLHVLTLVARSV